MFASKQIDSTQITKAIAQFLRTLISYRSKYDLAIERKAIFTKDEYEGFGLVNDQTKGDCIHCHITDGDALGTNLIFSNNCKFKVPSLRNLIYTAPYMHDGRFKTIEEVVEFYNTGVKMSPNIDSKMEYAHQGGVKLNTAEKRKIVAFLHTLSDSTFVKNPEFNNPFTSK